MFPEFFFHKAKEVLSFLHIMKGKVTGNDEVRKEGVNEALDAMDEERQVYLNEKREAQGKRDSDTGRDVSAI